MGLTERHQAGIDRGTGAIRRFNHHGAGAAIPLRTAFLSTGQPRRSQPIQQSHGRGRFGRERLHGAIQGEGDGHEFLFRMAEAKLKPGRCPFSYRLLPAFQPLDILIRKTEMMADFVDQHIADQAEQVFPGFDPFQQDGLAE